MNNTEYENVVHITPAKNICSYGITEREMRHRKIGVEAHRILVLLTKKRCCYSSQNLIMNIVKVIHQDFLPCQ